MDNIISIKGRKYYIKKEGEGNPIIFLHSSLVTSDMWNAQIDYFKQGNTVIAYDLFGQGRSEIAENEYSHHECLNDIITHFGLEKVDIVGCSFGASVGIDFCLEYPEKVNKMILITPSISGYKYPLKLTFKSIKNFQNCKKYGLQKAHELFEKEKFWNYFIPKDNEKKEFFKKLFVDNQSFYQSNPQKCSGLKPAAIKRLNEIAAEVLVITSELDSKFNRKAVETLKNEIINTSVIEVKESGHLPNIEQPDIVNSEIEKFIGSYK